MNSKLTETGGIFIADPSSNCYIEKNIFVRSDYIGNLGAGTHKKLYIRNNIFYKQSTPSYAAILSYSGANTIIEYNSFLSTDRIAVRSQISPNLVAINNYWNTNDTNIIDGMIYDRNDDLSVANYVEYLPFLSAPHPDTPIPDFNQLPVAESGVDQVVRTVNLDGSGSYDPDGSIINYDWSLQHRGNTSYNKTASGPTPTVSDLQPGFYDVFLTVTDNLGQRIQNSMLLAVAGEGTTWPTPNANLDVSSFRITKTKRTGITTTSMSGTIDLPELGLANGDTVRSRITIELFGSLAGGDDLVMSEEATLKVKETNKTLDIRK